MCASYEFHHVHRPTSQGQAAITRLGFSTNPLGPNPRAKRSIVFSNNITFTYERYVGTLCQARLQPAGSGAFVLTRLIPADVRGWHHAQHARAHAHRVHQPPQYAPFILGH